MRFSVALYVVLALLPLAVPVEAQLSFDFVPPTLLTPMDMTAEAGSTVDQVLHGRPHDGGTVSFTKVSGPAFMTVTTGTTAADGGVTGSIHLTPGIGDLGAFEAEIGAIADGRTDVAKIWITVWGAGEPPPVSPHDLGVPFYSVQVGRQPEDVELGDLDGDGNVDLVSADWFAGTITVAFGDGTGVFPRRQTYAVGGSPFAVAIADFDRDGKPDLAFTNYDSYTISTLKGLGSGLFGALTTITVGSEPAFLLPCDLNGDGIPDLVVANEGSNTVSVLSGHGDGTFAPKVDYPVGVEPCQLTVGDLNGDGYSDVVVVNETSNSLSVLLGIGGGLLGAQTQFPCARDPRTVVIGDWNEDGIPDLAVPAFNADVVSVLLGTGGGTFAAHTDYACGRTPWGLASADLNGDGHLDLISANNGDDGVSVLMGNGSGGFAPAIKYPTAVLARTVRAGDVNHDGKIDLAVDNEGGDAISILIGNGDGTFGKDLVLPSVYTTPLLAGDVNDDGQEDLILARGSSGMTVLFGPGGTGGSLDIDLGGTGSLFPGQAVLGDFNGDGHSDLALAINTGILVLPGLGGNAFGPPIRHVGAPGFQLVAGDFDGDGHLDLVVRGGTYPNIALTFLHGNGDGTFIDESWPVLVGIPIGLAAGDWNGDGIADVIASTIDPGVVTVFLGGPNGFQPLSSFPLDGRGSGLAFGLDVDGTPEILAPSTPPALPFRAPTPHPPFLVLRRGTDGSFSKVSVRDAGLAPSGIALIDLNGDGIPDPIVNDELAHSNGVFPIGQNGALGGRFDIGGSTPVGFDWNGDGAVDLIERYGSCVIVVPNLAPGKIAILPARAFTTPENHTVRLASQKPTTCVELEPIRNSFRLEDVNPTSLVLRSARTGTVGEIAGAVGNAHGRTDSDRNGIQELTVCYAQDDLARLFANVVGNRVISVVLAGNLMSGQPFRASLDLDVTGKQHQVQVSLAPNPLNPTAMLTVVTATPGPLRVRFYDVRGRLLGTLANERLSPAGSHTLRIGQGSVNGGELVSGVYFFTVEAGAETTRGRFVVLK